MEGAMEAGEPELKSVTIDICAYCLEGWGAECHTPGCIFWMCAVPPFETAQRLAYAEESKCYISDHKDTTEPHE